MVVAEPNGSGSDWVAFADEGNTDGFEAVFQNHSDKPKDRRGRASRREPSSKRISDSSSISSWMNQPISADASWAPVALPRASSAHKAEHPTAKKLRPPRTRSTATQQRSNPVSSSDSSSSSADKARGRSAELNSAGGLPRSSSRARKPIIISKEPQDSHRGRSRSRSRSKQGVPEIHDGGIVQMAPSRGRSSSRPRSNSISRHSTGASMPTAKKVATGRVGSRPPPTKRTGRSRSTSRNPGARARSTSRSKSTKPPSTYRTRKEMRVPASSSSIGPGFSGGNKASSGRSVVSEGGHKGSRSASDEKIGRDVTFGRTQQTRAPPGRQRSGLMEKLFGDHVPQSAKQSYLNRTDPSPRAASVSSVSFHPEKIHSRILLTATVYHNTATNLWIATINTNQKGVAKNPATASKFLKAFSFSSEKEARESAIANAPPKMLAFSESPHCHICHGKFAMFRRAGHCRNCGVCVCSSCSTNWPSKMIPETYNLKRESQVRVCNSCNHLSASFKKALLNGDYEEAVALYGSGNINLRTPFPHTSKKKDEIMHPIHCAVAGGNPDIVRWLVEDHFCPIKVIRTGSSKKPKRGGSADQLILTSQNRSVLTIAMTSLNVEILRYLVVDNSVSIYESKDLKSSLRALEAVLLALPNNSCGHRYVEPNDARWDDTSFDGQSFTSSLGADQTIGENTFASSKKRGADSCIICYENSIDCVMTPCGHQICCLECSKNLKTCPVCNVKGDFIKIFRP